MYNPCLGLINVYTLPCGHSCVEHHMTPEYESYYICINCHKRYGMHDKTGKMLIDADREEKAKLYATE